MIKVIVKTPGGKKSDIFPSTVTVHEALDELAPDCASQVNRINGAALAEEDFCKPLAEFSRDAEARIDVYPRPVTSEEMNTEQDSDSAGCTHDVVKQAILKAREALDIAMKALEEDELPF